MEPKTEPVATAVEEETLVQEELLVEEISIDGMCGVY
jgi:mycofactocin precursor